jgi:hypothetical protein
MEQLKRQEKWKTYPTKFEPRLSRSGPARTRAIESFCRVWNRNRGSKTDADSGI